MRAAGHERQEMLRRDCGGSSYQNGKREEGRHGDLTDSICWNCVTSPRLVLKSCRSKLGRRIEAWSCFRGILKSEEQGVV